ncbi:hypothetical protein FRB91_004416 [Serendipita sp. 411]|nr:hypothetical protein FRB91_004416 [Serendipita sp. 411]
MDQWAPLASDWFMWLVTARLATCMHSAALRVEDRSSPAARREHHVHVNVHVFFHGNVAVSSLGTTLAFQPRSAQTAQTVEYITITIRPPPLPLSPSRCGVSSFFS